MAELTWPTVKDVDAKRARLKAQNAALSALMHVLATTPLPFGLQVTPAPKPGSPEDADAWAALDMAIGKAQDENEAEIARLTARRAGLAKAERLEEKTE